MPQGEGAGHTNAVARDEYETEPASGFRDDGPREVVSRYPTLPRRQQEQ